MKLIGGLFYEKARENDVVRERLLALELHIELYFRDSTSSVFYLKHGRKYIGRICDLVVFGQLTSDIMLIQAHHLIKDIKCIIIEHCMPVGIHEETYEYIRHNALRIQMKKDQKLRN